MQISEFINKLGKIVLIIMGCFLAHFIYVTVRYGHSMDWGTCKQYLWIFKDSSIKNLTAPEGYFVCGSYVKKRDIRNVFHYYNNRDFCPIVVWEFKDLANIDLNKITINQNINLDNIKFLSGEELASDSSFPVNINYGFAFHNALNINLDSSSKIDGTFKGHNYKGFYGTVNKMSFSDEKGKHQIVFDYTPKPYKTLISHVVFLLYKGHQSFYVIIINSEKPFKDASIINILNLQ